MGRIIYATVCGLLLFVCVYFLVLRFTNLNSNPQGFFVDESSTAFNAYSILATGKDEHDAIFPVYFEAFGEFKNPIYIYSQVPFIKLFGLTRESARGASAFWGILTVVLFVLLLRLQRFKLPIILFGTAVFLVSPWHLILSRVAFEVISYPLFLVVAMICLFLFQRKEQGNFKYFLVFSAVLGLSFYSYTSARILSPALFVSAIIIFWIFLSFKKIFLSVLMFAVFLLPAFFWELVHPGSLQARYAVVGLSNYTHSTLEFVGVFALQYLSHFNPKFLFNGADGNIRHSLMWHSVLFWTTAPFLLFGIISTVKRITKFNLWALIAMALSFVPSALTIQSPHALRSIGFLPFAMYFIVVGASWVFSKNRYVFFVLIVFFVIEAFQSASYFQNNFRQTTPEWFDADAYQSIQIATFLDEPMFLSSKLYPGTMETARFLSGKVDVAFVVEPGQLLGDGTYVLTREECFSKQVVFENSSTCVVNFKSVK